jgi:hypothetical protein
MSRLNVTPNALGPTVPVRVFWKLRLKATEGGQTASYWPPPVVSFSPLSLQQSQRSFLALLDLKCFPPLDVLPLWVSEGLFLLLFMIELYAKKRLAGRPWIKDSWTSRWTAEKAD